MRTPLYLDRIWHVGLVRAPIARFLEPGFAPTIEWLPRPRFADFLADPFGVFRDDRLWLFAEAYDHGKRRGRIVSLQRGASGWSSPEDAFAPSHHVSFPYLFEASGQLLCMPEQWQAGRVSIYEVDLPQGRLGREVARVAELPGVDPVCFEHEGRHWVLTTDRRAHPQDALHAFYADSPFGPYLPHANNPIAIGAQARNAGSPFLCDGQLVRPTMDSRRRYGHAIELMEVCALTPTLFAQRLLRRIDPWDQRYCLGFHTLSSAGDLSFVDGLRPSWVPSGLRAAYANLRPGQPSVRATQS